jgi:hypothetical protein
MYNELNMIFDYNYIVNHSLDKDFSLEWKETEVKNVKEKSRQIETETET